MNKVDGLADRIKIWFVIGLLVVLSGCFLPGRGRYGGSVMIVPPAPDLFLFGGGYYRGSDARGYSHRGFESRGAAHPSNVERGRR